MSKKPGLNLADLSPQEEDIPVRDSFMTVRGISAREGMAIFQRFPKLAAMVGEGFSLGTFLTVAPEAVAAIIAAACGELGNEQAEKNAASLPLETQWDLLEGIGRLTFSKGFGPFIKRITDLVGSPASAPYTKAPVTKSPSPSKPSSQPDTVL